MKTSLKRLDLLPAVVLRSEDYTVEVRVEGFDPAAKRFTLEVNQRAVVDFDLNVVAVTEVVEVVDVVKRWFGHGSTLSRLLEGIWRRCEQV